MGKIRVELLVNDQVVRKAFADECQGEYLRRREWDVRQFKNQVGQIRLVDASRKGHINFDDMWGDFTCNGESFFIANLTDFAQRASSRGGTLKSNSRVY